MTFNVVFVRLFRLRLPRVGKNVYKVSNHWKIAPDCRLILWESSHMSKQTFITNAQQNKTLQKRLQELIEASQELKFLVGFFYFSGFSQLYKSLKETPDTMVKVLVGLEVDRHLNSLVETARQKPAYFVE